MSLRRRDTSSREIELKSVLDFLRMLLCMSGGITALGIIGFFLSVFAGSDTIIYQMVMVVNGILLVFGGISYWRLKKKSEKMECSDRERNDSGRL